MAIPIAKVPADISCGAIREFTSLDSRASQVPSNKLRLEAPELFHATRQMHRLSLCRLHWLVVQRLPEPHARYLLANAP